MKNTLFFFDEMPWLDTETNGFLQAFEFFWNDFGCALNNLVFIVSGSSTSWMDEKITKNKGGLYNRKTCSLFLKPFSLRETELYLESRNITWSRYDIAECYMIMGGIPYYLSLLAPDLSLAGNVDTLFFRKRAELWDEFDHLYQMLFSNSEQYIRVVEALSKKRGGMTRKEIAEETHIANNNNLSKILNNLVISDFVRRESFFKYKAKNARYILSDYYTCFYFRFIKNRSGRDEHFWSHAYDNPARRAWTGLTFEMLCKDHISQIKKKLSIGAVLSEESSGFVRADESSNLPQGAQIDLLIDRKDHVINLCEIKFSTGKFEITKSFQESLREKIEAFRLSSKTTKTLQTTMITTYGIASNRYSNMINNEVILDDLFEEEL